MLGGGSRDEGGGEEMYAIPGMPAAYLTTLCGVIKTLLQVEAQKGKVTYNGLRHCAQTIDREERYKAFSLRQRNYQVRRLECCLAASQRFLELSL